MDFISKDSALQKIGVSGNSVIGSELGNHLHLEIYFKGLDKVKNENISNFDLDRKLTEYISLLEQD